MDNIAEDAHREVEVLQSIWENQNHGRDHGHRVNDCNMFVLLTRTIYSSDMSSESWDGRASTGRNDMKKSVGVGWAESDIYIIQRRVSRKS